MKRVMIVLLVALVAAGFTTGCSDWSKTFDDWHIYTIDSEGVVGEWTSIAIDSNDKVHISYHDDTNVALKYATNRPPE